MISGSEAPGLEPWWTRLEHEPLRPVSQRPVFEHYTFGDDSRHPGDATNSHSRVYNYTRRDSKPLNEDSIEKLKKGESLTRLRLAQENAKRIVGSHVVSLDQHLQNTRNAQLKDILESQRELDYDEEIRREIALREFKEEEDLLSSQQPHDEILAQDHFVGAHSTQSSESLKDEDTYEIPRKLMLADRAQESNVRRNEKQNDDHIKEGKFDQDNSHALSNAIDLDNSVSEEFDKKYNQDAGTQFNYIQNIVSNHATSLTRKLSKLSTDPHANFYTNIEPDDPFLRYQQEPFNVPTRLEQDHMEALATPRTVSRNGDQIVFGKPRDIQKDGGVYRKLNLTKTKHDQGSYNLRDPSKYEEQKQSGGDHVFHQQRSESRAGNALKKIRRPPSLDEEIEIPRRTYADNIQEYGINDTSVQNKKVKQRPEDLFANRSNDIPGGDSIFYTLHPHQFKGVVPEHRSIQMNEAVGKEKRTAITIPPPLKRKSVAINAGLYPSEDEDFQEKITNIINFSSPPTRWQFSRQEEQFNRVYGNSSENKRVVDNTRDASHKENEHTTRMNTIFGNNRSKQSFTKHEKEPMNQSSNSTSPFESPREITFNEHTPDRPVSVNDDEQTYTIGLKNEQSKATYQQNVISTQHNATDEKDKRTRDKRRKLNNKSQEKTNAIAGGASNFARGEGQGENKKSFNSGSNENLKTLQQRANFATEKLLSIETKAKEKSIDDEKDIEKDAKLRLNKLKSIVSKIKKERAKLADSVDIQNENFCDLIESEFKILVDGTKFVKDTTIKSKKTDNVCVSNEILKQVSDIGDNDVNGLLRQEPIKQTSVEFDITDQVRKSNKHVSTHHTSTNNLDKTLTPKQSHLAMKRAGHHKNTPSKSDSSNSALDSETDILFTCLDEASFVSTLKAKGPAIFPGSPQKIDSIKPAHSHQTIYDDVAQPDSSPKKVTFRPSTTSLSAHTHAHADPIHLRDIGAQGALSEGEDSLVTRIKALGSNMLDGVTATLFPKNDHGYYDTRCTDFRRPF